MSVLLQIYHLASNWHQILIPLPSLLCPLLVPAPISDNFPDTKMISDFCLSDYIELNSTSAKPKIFLATKRYLSVINNYASLSLKRNCLMCVWGWRVRIFSYIYSKCWWTRGRLLNFWNGYQKLHIAISWFNGNVPYGIFLADHEHWIKMYEYLLNRRLTTCIIRLQNTF